MRTPEIKAVRRRENKREFEFEGPNYIQKMGDSYHLDHMFLPVVIILMFNYRAVWSLERKGMYLKMLADYSPCYGYFDKIKLE